MSDKSNSSQDLPRWTQEVSADEMVGIVRKILEEEGIKTTKDGRGQLRAAYERNIKSLSRPSEEIEQSGVESKEAAARKLIEIAKQSNSFDGYTRFAYIVAQRSIKAVQKRAERDKVCPAWPFC